MKACVTLKEITVETDRLETSYGTAAGGKDERETYQRGNFRVIMYAQIGTNECLLPLADLESSVCGLVVPERLHYNAYIIENRQFSYAYVSSQLRVTQLFSPQAVEPKADSGHKLSYRRPTFPGGSRDDGQTVMQIAI